jgi:hypothetical protein
MNFLQIPAEYQQVAAHFSKVMDEDVREIAAAVSKSFNDQISARLRQRQGEMLAKMAELASRDMINVDGAGPSTTDGDAGKTSASAAAEGGMSKSTTSAAVGGTSKSATGVAEGGTRKSATAGAEGGTSNANTDEIDDDYSTPPEITRKGAPPPSYLFLPADSTILCFHSLFSFSAETTVQDTEANKQDTEANKPGSSINEKKNMRKRAAINLNQGKKSKKLKLDEETKSVYEKHISKRILKKPVTKEGILEA